MAVQGIAALGCDPEVPNTASPVIISEQYVQDLIALKPSGDRLWIRLKITSRESDNELVQTSIVDAYRVAIQAYTNNGFAVRLIFTHETLRPNPNNCPNAPLNQNLTNPYILAFATRLVNFRSMLNLPDANMPYIIWNKPNKVLVTTGDCSHLSDSPNALSPQVFAALMSYTSAQLTAAGYQGTIAMGALSYINGVTSIVALRAYFDAVYTWLEQNGRPIPWESVLLNVYTYFTATEAQDLRTAILEVQQAHGDNSPLLIGEWGPQGANYDPGLTEQTYNALKTAGFPAMTYFSHDAVENDCNREGLVNYGFQPGTPYTTFVVTGKCPQGNPVRWDKLQQLYQSP